MFFASPHPNYHQKYMLTLCLYICAVKVTCYINERRGGMWDTLESSKSIYYYIVQFFFYQTMSCYLKISYLSRHRKYRYCKDKPINFQQIRKQLLVNLPPQFIIMQVQVKEPKKGEAHDQLRDVRMNEQELSNYLKGIELNEKETIRVKFVEANTKLKTVERFNKEDNDQSWLPIANQRVNSRSDEVKMQTANFDLKTDGIQVTQEFLCNSNIERIQSYSASVQVSDIMKELQINQMKLKQLAKRKKQKDIGKLYSDMKSIITNDLNIIQ